MKTSGEWLVFEPMESLDEIWHTTQHAVKSGECGRGGTAARCSTSWL